MENNIAEKMLEVKINGAKDKLRDRIEGLKYNLEYALEQLDKNPHYKPNSLGIIQYSGQEIDVLCGRLGSLYEMQEVISYLKE